MPNFACGGVFLFCRGPSFCCYVLDAKFRAPLSGKLCQAMHMGKLSESEAIHIEVGSSVDRGSVQRPRPSSRSQKADISQSDIIGSGVGDDPAKIAYLRKPKETWNGKE